MGRVLPSPLSDDWRDEVVSSESAVSSTKRPEASSRSSSRTSSEMPSPTPSTPSERRSPLSMSSTLSSDRAELSTDSAAKRRKRKQHQTFKSNGPFQGHPNSYFNLPRHC